MKLNKEHTQSYEGNRIVTYPPKTTAFFHKRLCWQFHRQAGSHLQSGKNKRTNSFGIANVPVETHHSFNKPAGKWTKEELRLS